MSATQPTCYGRYAELDSMPTDKQVDAAVCDLFIGLFPTVRAYPAIERCSIIRKCAPPDNAGMPPRWTVAIKVYVSGHPDNMELEGTPRR